MYFTMELMDMVQDANDAFYTGNDAELRDCLDNLEGALDYLIDNQVMMIPKSLYERLCELANAEVIVMSSKNAERKVEEYKRKKIQRNTRKEKNV